MILQILKIRYNGYERQLERMNMMQFDLMIENLHLKDINPLNCGYHDCPKSHAYGPTIREYYLIHHVHSGKGVLYNDRGEHEIEQDQLFVIRPGEVTTYQADDKDPWDYSWIGFDGNEYTKEILTEDIYQVSNSGVLFNQMTSTEISEGREFYLCAKIYELLALIQSEKDSLDTGTSRYIRIAKNFIESNYHKDIKVSQIADNLSLDRSYFSHLFTSQMDISPQQYLLKLRFENASNLLIHSDYTIGEIAHQVGYPDVSAFSRMFKRYMGLAPGTYRKENKGVRNR